MSLCSVRISVRVEVWTYVWVQPSVEISVRVKCMPCSGSSWCKVHAQVLIHGHIIQTTFTLSSDSYLCRIRAEVRIRVRVGLMFSSDLSDPDFCTSQSRSRVGFDLKFRLCLVHDRVSLVLQ